MDAPSSLRLHLQPCDEATLPSPPADSALMVSEPSTEDSTQAAAAPS